MAAAVGAAEILRLRLSAHRIENPSGVELSVVDVTRQLFALQGQDFIQGGWALGVRAPGSRLSDLIAALDAGTIVRSAPFRGTLFFLPAEELRWVLGVTAPRTIAGSATRQRQLGLDEAILDRARAATIAALQGGKALARDEYFALLRSIDIDPSAQRGYHVIWHLAQTGLICWGPASGTQQALVLLDEWVSTSRDLSGDEALRELALRYFTGHGPATLRDFAWWAKLTLASARTGLALAADDLVELEHGGESYWASAREIDLASGRRRSTAVHALPGFDEYLLGYTDRSLPLDDEHFARIVPGSNGIFLPMIVAGGRIVGTWRRAEKSGGVTVTPDAFGDLTTRETAAFALSRDAFARFRTS
ncbi:winged helix DNA-binding domain-containing protein [Lacisediminihabitans changchengi]|uniref:AlkZ family DNA glycosylase n=1 Tax=Lacisediminihabitans changchengi TaxID=2787634 RepID=A0A934SIX1_9MICO|nr:winged helix DNA-binding domain-containing protein [Lacisediminihabitans changchengi]MBK4346106.1 AlkZ family DNA glycosylase [Lacisediminihabitans changchengi]